MGLFGDAFKWRSSLKNHHRNLKPISPLKTPMKILKNLFTKPLFSKPKPTADRRRRLMGNLLDVFDIFEGKAWATLIGVVIMLVLIVLSIPPEWLAG